LTGTNRLATMSALQETEDHGFAVVGGHSRERAFERARRHSRRVRMLRIAIPVAIVTVLAGLTLLTWLDPLRVLVRLPIDSGKLVISGTKITMQAPKLSGYTRDSRWYEISALSAAQDVTKPDIIELQDVRAMIEADDKNTLRLAAAAGMFDRKTAVLTLARDILLTSTGGYELRLTEAVIDTRSGEIVSDKPVELRMLQGTLNANRLEVVKVGEIIRFAGGVVLDLPAGSTSPQGPAARSP
jgi:lipopolysaccharide export system protein LptC